jgi:hypothetical protein
MRARMAFSGVVGVIVLCAPAIAQAPAPRGSFGGGGLVAPTRDHFGPGNAVVALRAMRGGRLELEGTVRGRCGGGEFAATARLADDGSFRAKGRQRTEPERGVTVRTSYEVTGTFSSATAADGVLKATIQRTSEGRTRRCRSGTVRFGLRRPNGRIGAPGAPGGARYYGTTSQRGVGPHRPIVLRVSGDGRVISRALFGESVRCSDRTRMVGVEAPRTNARISRSGLIDDRERFTISSDTTLVRVDDRFTGRLGATGGRGTLSLSDRTFDRATGNVIRSCRSGTVRWRAAR